MCSLSAATAHTGADRKKLRDADAMLNAGKDQAAVIYSLEVSDATHQAEDAKCLKQLEDENKLPKEFVAEKELDIKI